MKALCYKLEIAFGNICSISVEVSTRPFHGRDSGALPLSSTNIKFFDFLICTNVNIVVESLKSNNHTPHIQESVN